MKKPNPITQSFAEAEKRIRKDQSEKDFNAVAKAMSECYELASKIMQRMSGFKPAKEGTVTATRERDPLVIIDGSPAPKRKAVTATKGHIDAAYHVLLNITPPNSPLTADNVAAVWIAEGGKRLAGAALKDLVRQGRIAVKRGKYYLPVAPPADNSAPTPAAQE